MERCERHAFTYNYGTTCPFCDAEGVPPPLRPTQVRRAALQQTAAKNEQQESAKHRPVEAVVTDRDARPIRAPEAQARPTHAEQDNDDKQRANNCLHPDPLIPCVPAVVIHQDGKTASDGSTASYYELPLGATELQDLIAFRDMNAQMGEIFRACYRYGMVAHSPKARDLKKIIFYAQAELDRIRKYEANSGQVA